MIERLFKVRAVGSTPGREVLGGVTTFLTMAYILAVNPVFMTAAGMPLRAFGYTPSLPRDCRNP